MAKLETGYALKKRQHDREVEKKKIEDGKKAEKAKKEKAKTKSKKEDK